MLVLESGTGNFIWSEGCEYSCFAGNNYLGFHTTISCTPIIPILFNKPKDAADLSGFLKEHQIIAPFVNYPVKTAKSIVRLTASAAHTDQQIHQLLAVLEIWKKTRPERMH